MFNFSDTYIYPKDKLYPKFIIEYLNNNLEFLNGEFMSNEIAHYNLHKLKEQNLRFDLIENPCYWKYFYSNCSEDPKQKIDKYAFLVDYLGIDINKYSRNTNEPITFYASGMWKDLDLCKILLEEKGFDVNQLITINNNGSILRTSMLSYAIKYDNYEIIDYLLSKGYDKINVIPILYEVFDVPNNIITKYPKLFNYFIRVFREFYTDYDELVPDALLKLKEILDSNAYYRTVSSVNKAYIIYHVRGIKNRYTYEYNITKECNEILEKL